MAGERFRLTRIADALATMCPILLLRLLKHRWGVRVVRRRLGQIQTFLIGTVMRNNGQNFRTVELAEKVGGETGGRGWRDAWSSACCALELHLASVASKPCLF